MGHPGKHARIHRPHRLPPAAAPTLLGLAAAALCLSAQAAPAGAATTAATAQHAAAAAPADSSPARLMSAARAAAHDAHVAHMAHMARVAAHAAPKAAPAATYSGGGSFQSCVIARESGGNPQAMNASGHYGLYQFSYATWVAYGGSPAAFGHATVAQQNQVFSNTIAAGGQSNWAPYDGC
jgi:resuscitation-promoting factor RpfB